MEAPNATPLVSNTDSTLLCNVINSEHTPEAQERIDSIANEAAQLFPPGAVHNSPQDLRDAVRDFSHRNCFSVSSEGHSIVCSRANATDSSIRKCKKLKAKVPLEKQRNRKSTRCGCPFVVRCSPVNNKNKEDKRVRITSCNFHHGNGCLPSKAQLAVEKRKAGAITRAINKSQIKSIMSVLSTGTRISTATFRELVKPIFPNGNLSGLPNALQCSIENNEIDGSLSFRPNHCDSHHRPGE